MVPIDLLLSADGALDANSIDLGTVLKHVIIPAGRKAPLQLLLPFTGVVPGSYTVIAKLDPNNTLSDANLTNNTAFSTINVTPSADLQITNSAPATAVAGTVVTYTIIATNAGPNNIAGASVIDTFPTSVTGITYTSNITGSGIFEGTGGGTLSIGGILNGFTATVHGDTGTVLVNGGGITGTFASSTGTGISFANNGNNRISGASVGGDLSFPQNAYAQVFGTNSVGGTIAMASTTNGIQLRDGNAFLTINSGGQDIRLEALVRNLADAGSYALDEAQMEGVDYGLLIEEEQAAGATTFSYRWVERYIDVARHVEEWREPASGKEVFARQQLPPGIALERCEERRLPCTPGPRQWRELFRRAPTFAEAAGAAAPPSRCGT